MTPLRLCLRRHSSLLALAMLAASAQTLADELVSEGFDPVAVAAP